MNEHATGQLINPEGVPKPVDRLMSQVTELFVAYEGAAEVDEDDMAILRYLTLETPDGGGVRLSSYEIKKTGDEARIATDGVRAWLRKAKDGITGVLGVRSTSQSPVSRDISYTVYMPETPGANPTESDNQFCLSFTQRDNQMLRFVATKRNRPTEENGYRGNSEPLDEGATQHRIQQALDIIGKGVVVSQKEREELKWRTPQSIIAGEHAKPWGDLLAELSERGIVGPNVKQSGTYNAPGVHRLHRNDVLTETLDPYGVRGIAVSRPGRFDSDDNSAGMHVYMEIDPITEQPINPAGVGSVFIGGWIQEGDLSVGNLELSFQAVDGSPIELSLEQREKFMATLSPAELRRMLREYTFTANLVEL